MNAKLLSSKKTNLLFVNPSPMPFREQKQLLDDSVTSRLPDFNVPIGIIDLSAYIKNKLQNIDIELLDLSTDLHKIYREMTNSGKKSSVTRSEFYLNEIESVKITPDIVGISILYSTSYYSALELAKLCRQKWPNAKIISGGNHATAYYKLMLEDPNIDLVFRGEAETSFVEYLKQFQKSKTKKVNINSIKGAYDRTRAKKSNADFAESAVLLEDLDGIGVSDYSLLDLDIFKVTSNIIDTGSVSVMWSRGCPYKCTFCASHIVHGRMIRHKSNDLIIKELLHVKKLGFKRIAVYDDLFAGNRKKFLELVDKMDEAGLIGDMEYLLLNSLSVTVMTEKVIDAIIRMGVQFFKFSIESGSQYTQDHIIHKNVNLKRARKIIEYAQTKNKHIEAYLILGFPKETRELMQESIDFYHSIDVDWVPIFSALPLPGSDMYKEYIEMGVISDETFNWDLNRFPLRDFDTPEIDKDELHQLIYDTNISLNFFGNSNIKHGRYERAIHSFNKMVLKRYPWHVVGIYCRGLAYLKMKEHKKAENDFKQCVKLIKTDERSKKMFQRYSHEMEYLDDYFGPNEKNIMATVKDSKAVDVLQFIS